MSRLSASLALLLPILAFAHEPEQKAAPVALIDGLGDIHHPVSTKNAEAQKFFDQGLRLIYAFNHDEARRSFAKAAELDAQLAMAYWGMALAVGPNYNADADDAQLTDAFTAIQKALALSKDAPEHERAYIEALAKRYDEFPLLADKKQLALAYKNAMGKLVKRYPDDLDAATLYAESMMNLRPWDLWIREGKPTTLTREIVEVLEGVLRRNPDHTGANHYYIHAIEASPHPERGLASAERLKTLAPAAGHLVHMPAHIYIRVGDFEQAARSNLAAIDADRAYMKKFKPMGIYPMMYYSHNIHFLAVARLLQGRYADAKKAADELVAHVEPHAKDMPMLEYFLPTPLFVQIRSERWDELLAARAPDAKLKFVKAIWHYGRGLAYLSGDKTKAAAAEHEELKKTIASIPEDMLIGQLNLAREVLVIPEKILSAKIARAQGNARLAVLMLTMAIVAEDKLRYMEPADWYLPARESLGALLLRQGDAVAAEKVFRDDLEHNRRNPRSLLGLAESLRAQKKTYAADLVQRQFEAAWRHADGVKLKVEDY